jgi:dihydrofolate reductase
LARLIYSILQSLDGYIADAAGAFDWAAPDEAVHGFINDLMRPVGTHLYGRRMYEVLAAWEQVDPINDESQVMRDFAASWQAAEKIVYSRTLNSVSSARTRIERDFDPDAVRRLKASAERDLVISGPDLAAHALRAGLVDECGLFVTPVIVGGGTPSLPAGLRRPLELLDERRFASGVVYLRYQVNQGA